MSGVPGTCLAREVRSGNDSPVLFSVRMRRKVQIVVSMMAMLLLIRPLDCLAFGADPAATTKCCMKGKCAPTAKADDCCRASVPGDSQCVPGATADYPSPQIHVAATPFAKFVPTLRSQLHFDTVRHPPPLSRVQYTPPLRI
jgi:hypothetical protein